MPGKLQGSDGCRPGARAPRRLGLRFRSFGGLSLEQEWKRRYDRVAREPTDARARCGQARERGGGDPRGLVARRAGAVLRRALFPGRPPCRVELLLFFAARQRARNVARARLEVRRAGHAVDLHRRRFRDDAVPRLLVVRVGVQQVQRALAPRYGLAERHKVKQVAGCQVGIRRVIRDLEGVPGPLELDCGQPCDGHAIQ